MLKFATFAVALLVTSPALAGSPAQQPAPPNAQAAKADPLDKIVCKTEDTVGTRLGSHRVCATLREWKDQQEDNRAALEKIQQGQGNVPSG